MKQITTILGCLLFFLASYYKVYTADQQPKSTGYNTVAAATLPQFSYSSGYANAGTLPTLSKDLILDLAKQQNLLITEPSPSVSDSLTDSLKARISYLESVKPVVRVKWRKGPAPPPVIERDTVKVPVYYLATQVGIREGPNGNCISVYEIKQVDEICPENLPTHNGDISE